MGVGKSMVEQDKPNDFAKLHADHLNLLYMAKRMNPMQVISIFFSAGIPAVITILLTSDFTPVGRTVYAFIGDSGNVDGFHIWQLAIVTAIILAFFGYIMDIHEWKGAAAIAKCVYFGVVGLMFLVGIVFMSAIFPSIPLLIGLTASLVAVVGLRFTMLKKMLVQDFSFAAGIAFAALASILFVSWVLWVFGVFDGDVGNPRSHTALDANFMKPGLRELTGFVIWCSPIMLAIAFGLMSLLLILRSRLHVEHKDNGAVRSSQFVDPLDNDRDDGEDFEAFIVGELKLIIACLVMLILVAYVAAGLEFEEMELSKAVLRVAAFTFVALLIYMFFSLGFERIQKASEKNETVQNLVEFSHSDWVKGLELCIFWPLLPLYFGVEAAHQRIRIIRHKVVGVSDEDSEPASFAGEAQYLWDSMVSWNWTSVLRKSMIVGIAFFLAEAATGQIVAVLLSALNDYLRPMSLWLILLILFAFGLSLFLLPPVPGFPIYCIAGIVVVTRCYHSDFGMWTSTPSRAFWTGVLIAFLFCMSLKMIAIALEQKGIGEPLSNNVTVKKMVGVHTPTMKAIRHILRQPGFHLNKVSVLVGGPDWPTSVITGILRLDLREMLLSSTPVAFLIFPVILAAAFMVRAGEAEEANAQRYNSIAQALAMVAAQVQMASMIIAGYYVQMVTEYHKPEMMKKDSDWEKDPQEAEVLASIAKDEEQESIRCERTSWRLTPSVLRVLTIAGSIMTSFMLYIIVLPFFHPFKEFEVTSRISDLPGGSVWSIINKPDGWAAIILVVLAICCLTSHEIWCQYQIRRPPEEKPLVKSV